MNRRQFIQVSTAAGLSPLAPLAPISAEPSNDDSALKYANLFADATDRHKIIWPPPKTEVKVGSFYINDTDGPYPCSGGLIHSAIAGIEVVLIYEHDTTTHALRVSKLLDHPYMWANHLPLIKGLVARHDPAEVIPSKSFVLKMVSVLSGGCEEGLNREPKLKSLIRNLVPESHWKFIKKWCNREEFPDC